MRITVEMGGERKRCTLLTKPKRRADGALWARARHAGEEFAITEVWGVWLKQSAWEHVCRVLDASAAARKSGTTV